MKFKLTGYQVDAVGELIPCLEEASTRFQKSRRTTAISLSAPTGAGKTVIATAVIERLFFGGDDSQPNPKLSVLWVSDDPNLNQQTKRKFLLASSMLKASQLVTVDTTFDQERFDIGKVYFVHIQQLGKGSTNYQKTGDIRQYSLWETIRNTISKSGENFLLIVDEAHRGTKAKAGGGKTITAEIIDGAGGTFPPTPVVLGISATPARFVEAISKSGQRTLEMVGVDVAAVRESGLLKDKILIKHPKTHQVGDLTLLELAVSDLKSYDKLWADYAVKQNEPTVQPVLVIQVRPLVSDAELSAIVKTLGSAWSVLKGNAIAHSFQEHSSIKLGSDSLRYVAPQDIQDDAQLRVVLFKEALTTGWDCPRAEVMLSFRTAQDYTYIAQLIGRMVRTPLARRIATNDVLNSVALYLPSYDEQQVNQVVTGLKSDDTNLPVDIEVQPVVCERNKAVPDEAFAAVEGLPSYTRPAKHFRSEVARLNALAMLLVGNGLDVDAIDAARKHNFATLDRESKRLGKALGKSATALEKLIYQTQDVDLLSGVVVTSEAKIGLHAKNVDDLFRVAQRAFTDSSAKWYWDDLCDAGKDADEGKLLVAALASDPSVGVALEAAAKSLIDTWRNQHNAAINKLKDAKRSQFYDIWQQAKEPQLVSVILPSHITAQNSETVRTKHLFADAGQYPAKFTGWEISVLDKELESSSLLGWYRNPTGGLAALAVPYEESTQARTLYPDFLFAHKVEDGVAVDIVDPHNPNSADAGPKWRGLAQYAKVHADKFRRVLAVIRTEEKVLVSVDLKNPDVAKAMAKATNGTDIRKVFKDFGGNY